MFRRVMYASAFLVVLAVVAGVFAIPERDRGANLLVTAAQAMQQADTVHARAQGELGLPSAPSASMRHPGSGSSGQLGGGSGGGPVGGMYGAPSGEATKEPFWEYWYSPEGFRWERYGRTGKLEYSFAGNVAAGHAWQYLPIPNVVLSYTIAREDLAAFVERSRQRFLEADLRLADIVERGHEWATRTEVHEGAEMLVVVEDLGSYLVSGSSKGSVEYYVDPTTDRLVGFRQYGAERDGKPLIAELKIVEYGTQIPSVVFEFDPPPDTQVIEGAFEVRRSGYIAFQGMSYVPDYDPRTDWLIEKAYETRHWAGLGKGSWEAVEAAYLAVLAEDPENRTARTYVGRMYTRWGRFEEALSLLPEDGGPWAELTRAFCLDALGRREEAVALYRKLADWYSETGCGSTIARWARLGLKQPTWPADVEIRPEPGEFRLKPTSAWHVAASDSALHYGPEWSIDGDRRTSWGNGGSPDKMQDGQHPGQWFKLEFDTPQLVSRIVLDGYGEETFYVSNWARGVKATVTTDGLTWQPVQVSPGGPMQLRTVRFDPPRQIRGIRFEITSTHVPEWWSIAEVWVFSKPG